MFETPKKPALAIQLNPIEKADLTLGTITKKGRDSNSLEIYTDKHGRTAR